MKNWEISQKVSDYVNSRYEEYYESCLRYAPDILTFQLFDINHQIAILDEAVEIYGTNLSEDFTLLLYNLMNSTDHVFEDSSVYQQFTEYLYDKYMIPKEKSILESAYDCGMLDRDMPEELAYRIALGFDMDSVKKTMKKEIWSSMTICLTCWNPVSWVRFHIMIMTKNQQGVVFLNKI